jgi:RNA polymerase sigma-70 factor (ECF subfamily)
MKKTPSVSKINDSIPAGKDGHPGDQLELKERRKMLESALSVLDEPFRSTIINSVEGLTINEIANKNGLPQNTVKTRLFRAREKLKKILRALNGGDSL